MTIHVQDPESEAFLHTMTEQQRVRGNRVSNVKTVLVVLSAAGMVYDVESLRQKILLSYPEAAIFFETTDGKPIGASSPSRVDLLVDLTGPGQRQGIFRARKLKGRARVAVGRNAGFFRKKIYARIFDEKEKRASLPSENLDRERVVQKEVLRLAGVAFVQMGDSAPDRGKVTPLSLPPMQKL